MNRIKEVISNSISVKQAVLADETLLNTVEQVANIITEAFRNDKKVLFCGNGGSAADAQHLAAEFSGRFYFDRDPLFSEALHVNTSYLTAVANDYSYEQVYSRLIKAKGRQGDVLVGLSTSGNSLNVVRAFEQGKENGMTIVAMTGLGGGKMKDSADFLIDIPSKDTPRIQECHMMLGHIICELVEAALFQREVVEG
ncbi:MAG: D-sedoheptulose 7-phosphate isomerase [Bacteroidia bacterium]